MIDLQNEAAYRNDMTPEWIEYTLDIIEDWEQRTGNDILVGMDYDHFYKSKDPGLENALSNPRLELIMCEGSEGHVIPELVAGSRKPISEELAIKYRKLYKKPVVSANSPCYWPNEQTIKGWNPVTGPEEGYDPTISIPAVRQYQWASMLLKVQGAGVYAKSYPLDFSELKLRTYAQESRLLIDFFGSLKDYVALEISPDVVAESPVRYAHVLSAENEAVVYLHADGFKKTVTAGQVLRLQKLKMTDGSVEILLCHPATGVWQRENVPIQNGNVTINLPEFYEDLALHILSLDE